MVSQHFNQYGLTNPIHFMKKKSSLTKLYDFYLCGHLTDLHFSSQTCAIPPDKALHCYYYYYYYKLFWIQPYFKNIHVKPFLVSLLVSCTVGLRLWARAV